MFVPNDIARIENIIECTYLELKTWDYLSPTQRQSLVNKAQKFEHLLIHVKEFLNGRQ